MYNNKKTECASAFLQWCSESPKSHHSDGAVMEMNELHRAKSLQALVT